MIDLTLDSLLVPDILGYDPPFGQKVVTTPENKGGLSTQQVNDNILLPFAKQRAVVIEQSDTISQIEYDAKVILKNTPEGGGITVTIGTAQYPGCILTIACMATSATVNINGEDFTLRQGSYQEVFYDGEKWVGMYPIVGDVKIQYAGQLTPQKLYIATEWEDISSQYAGLFFRAKGGDALPFGQTQEEGLPNIKGTTSGTKADKSSTWDSGLTVTKNATGAFVTKTKKGETSIETLLSSNYTAWLNDDFDASRSSNIYGKSSHVTPKNQAVTMWRRKG